MAAPDIAGLQALLANNELDAVLHTLQHPAQCPDENIQAEAILLAGRLDRLRQDIRRGTIANEDAGREESRIRAALLELIDLLKQTTSEKPAERFWRKYKRLLFGGFTGGLLWYSLLPMPAVRIEAALLVERLSFRYEDGPTDFAQGHVQWCSWQNYRHAGFSGERLRADDNADGRWEYSLDLDAPLELTANPDIAGLAIQFGPARLEQLSLRPKAMLTLSRPEDDPALLHLTIQQPEDLEGEWIYRDSLNIQAEQCTASGIPGETDFVIPVRLCILAPAGAAREIAVSSFGGITHLDLKVADTLAIKSRNLAVSELSFYQPVENMALPTLLGGEIQITELDKPVLRSISLAEGEALDISAVDKLSVSELGIGPEGITLRFSGKVTKIGTGQQLDLRHPTRMEWLWCNYPMLLWATAILIIAGFVRFYQSAHKP